MEWGLSRREIERERQKWIKVEGDGAKVRIWNGVDWEKWPLEKTPENLRDRTNETSIKMDINILGGFNFAGLLCRDFCFL